MSLWNWLKGKLSERPKDNSVVEENSYPISPEQMSRFEDSIKEHYDKHEDERRRSIEIAQGFLEKLATLAAGSIAVAASILLAIVFKSDPSALLTLVIHETILVVVFLWVSLALSLWHNFLATQIAYVDADYSLIEFVWALTKETISISRENEPISEDTFKQLEKLLREQTIPERSKLVENKHRHYKTMRTIAVLAMVSFLIAYLLVGIFLFRLW